MACQVRPSCLPPAAQQHILLCCRGVNPWNGSVSVCEKQKHIKQRFVLCPSSKWLAAASHAQALLCCAASTRAPSPTLGGVLGVKTLGGTEAPPPPPGRHAPPSQPTLSPGEELGLGRTPGWHTADPQAGTGQGLELAQGAAWACQSGGWEEVLGGWSGSGCGGGWERAMSRRWITSMDARASESS